ncbi:hypothetical protein [Ensifer sp. B1-9]|uniref:hypothetical protein n=1 Tax=Ensifer sp. B1-9 TaxID=3141455 RepID=UPI003D235C2A
MTWALISCEGNLNLQRGTAAAVALGGEATKDASAEFGMLLFWAGNNHLICMTAMPCAHPCTFLQRTIKMRHKKQRAHSKYHIRNSQL